MIWCKILVGGIGWLPLIFGLAGDAYATTLSIRTLTLDDCLSLAFQNDTSCKAAVEEKTLARRTMQQTWRDLFPKVSVMYEESRGKRDADYAGREYKVQASQALYHGKSLFYTYQKERVAYDIATLNLQKVQDTITFNVRELFDTALKWHGTSLDLDELFKRANAMMAGAVAQYEQDLIPELELWRVTDMFHKIAYQTKVFLRERDFSLLALRTKIGLPDNVLLELEGVLSVQTQELTAKELLHKVLRQQPELLMASYRVKEADLGRKAAQGQLQPQVDLVGHLGRKDEKNFKKDLNLQKEWFVGVNVSVPLGGSTARYDYGRESSPPSISEVQSTRKLTHTATLSLWDQLNRYTSVQEGEAGYAEAWQHREELQAQYTLEVQRTYDGLQNAGMRYDHSVDRQEYLTRSRDIQKFRHQHGDGSLSETWDVELNLMEANTEYWEALGAYAVAYHKLQFLVGDMEGRL